MVLQEVCDLVNGEVLCGHSRLKESVEFAFSSDLMSDVLTVKKEHFLLHMRVFVFPIVVFSLFLFV